jgi:hypothetical protein
MFHAEYFNGQNNGRKYVAAGFGFLFSISFFIILQYYSFVKKHFSFGAISDKGYF